MPKRYYYRDLKDKGYGSRNTVAKKVRDGNFPSPYEDEHGRPFWDDQQLETHDAELKKKQYVSTPISHLQKCEELESKGT
jgi:hypothetical protein